MKVILQLLLTLCLFGCNAPPVDIHYYLLHTPKVKTALQKSPELPIVLLKQLRMADYLRQSNLVMLLEQHELYYSRQDVWADSLESSFYQALLQDLNQSPTYHFVSQDSPLADAAQTVIKVNLTHFHSSYASSVVTAGSFWLSPSKLKTTSKDALLISQYSFYYELELQQDGFPHAVGKLRQTVSQLAEQINKDITALPSN